MICCKECLELLYDYLEGELSPDVSSSLEEHLEEESDDLLEKTSETDGLLDGEKTDGDDGEKTYFKRMARRMLPKLSGFFAKH